jgi:3-deoxy-7-phosphoheptulonate synthase
VDCSHGNSSKKPELQPQVFRDCINQLVAGNTSIVGMMLESHLSAGRQDIPADLSQLKYGVSVTDGCIDWATTEELLVNAHERLRSRAPEAVAVGAGV